MEENVFTINWQAIGSITTGLGLIFAFVSLFISNWQNNKNRDLEKKIKRQDNEQKSLDEYVQIVLKMLSLLRCNEITENSKKCCSKFCTNEELQYFDNLSFQFSILLQELYLKKHKIKPNKNTISIQNHLESINLHLKDLSYKFKISHNIDFGEDEIPYIIERIKKLNGGKLTEICNENIFDCADRSTYLYRLLHEYSLLINNEILSSIFKVKDNIEEFMTNEQERIDNLLNDDTSKKHK